MRTTRWLMTLVGLTACGENPHPGAARDTGPPSTGALAFDGEPPRNLLVLSLDTTRADALSEAPTLQALFNRGYALDDHRSCSSWTLASMVCALTGRRGLEWGYIPEFANLRSAPADLTWAAEILGDEGWRARLVTSNIFFSDEIGADQGFEQTDYRQDRPAQEVTDQALLHLDELSADDAAPWYLQVHYFDPHDLYTPPGEYLDALDSLAPIPYDLDSRQGYQDMDEAWGALDAETQALVQEHLLARYRAEVRYMDDEIARLLDTAGAAGALEDTLILVFTDHGEQLYEHGDRGHGENLYEHENRAMAAFIAPGLAPGSWGGPTTHVDLLPTLLGALGVRARGPTSGHVVGEAPDDRARTAIVYRDHDTAQFVERGGSKLVYRWSGQKSLYRLAEDPLEQTDRYDPDDDEVLALWELLLPEVEALSALFPDASEPADPGP